jgi:hypothetical protein
LPDFFQVGKCESLACVLDYAVQGSLLLRRYCYLFGTVFCGGRAYACSAQYSVLKSNNRRTQAMATKSLAGNSGNSASEVLPEEVCYYGF